MKKFPKTYSLPKQSQEETDNLNRLITPCETESGTKTKTPCKQKSRTGWLHWNYTKQRRTHTYPSQNLPKTQEERTLPKSFYEATITLITKPDKATTKKKITGKYL